MRAFKTIVGRQLNNRYVVYDYDLNTFSIEFAETIRDYETDVYLTNAYWDTAEKKLIGVCLDLDALPIVNTGKEADYFVYVGMHEGGLVYVKPYGACTELSGAINWYAKDFIEFFTENKVYGGVGDDDCYDLIWKPLYRNTIYRTPVSFNEWEDMTGAYGNCLSNIHSGEYVKMPFGLTNFRFEDTFLYRNCFGALYLPKSLRYLNMDGLMDVAGYCCEKVILPSSISYVYVQGCKNKTYEFYFECNPNSYLWGELIKNGYERLLSPNYNI